MEKNGNKSTTISLSTAFASQLRKELDVGDTYEIFLQKIYEHYKSCTKGAV